MSSGIARAVVVVALSALVSCSKHESAPIGGACDDSVPRGAMGSEIPQSVVQEGFEDVVGDGDVWLVLPEADQWGALVSPGRAGEEHVGKFPVYVDATVLPDVEAFLSDEPSTAADVSMEPTAAGLPGPVPVGVNFPSPGCWEVKIVGQSGRVAIRVQVG